MFAVFFVQCVTGGIEAEPTCPVQTVYPGETATPRVALEKPDNVNVAKENPYKLGDVPVGWTVNIDNNGQITATAPADAKPGDQVKIPVTVTYEDGSTNTAYAVVNVVDVLTREVPFKVEYKYDNTIPAGEYEVETKGEPGSEKMIKDGTWEQTKAPVNEVVVVGTKPAESAKEVRWTVPIPYPTEVRENPALKPGETKVVQEGKPGEVKHTVGVEIDDKGNVTKGEPKSETVSEPVKQVIEVGPAKDHESTLTDKHTEKTPFETIIEYDPNLEVGKVDEDQPGAFGEKEITKTWKLKNGQPVGDPETSEKVVKDPQPRKIRLGSKCNCEQPSEEPTGSI